MFFVHVKSFVIAIGRKLIYEILFFGFQMRRRERNCWKILKKRWIAYSLSLAGLTSSLESRAAFRSWSLLRFWLPLCIFIVFFLKAKIFEKAMRLCFLDASRMNLKEYRALLKFSSFALRLPGQTTHGRSRHEKVYPCGQLKHNLPLRWELFSWYLRLFMCLDCDFSMLLLVALQDFSERIFDWV